MLLALATSVAAIHGFRSIEMIGRGPRVTCPPRVYGIIENFDARQYFNGSWYPLAQQLSIFQPERTFLCTRATYSLQESGDVKAINEARKTCADGNKRRLLNCMRIYPTLMCQTRSRSRHGGFPNSCTGTTGSSKQARIVSECKARRPTLARPTIGPSSRGLVPFEATGSASPGKAFSTSVVCGSLVANLCHHQVLGSHGSSKRPGYVRT